jgi:hypothetical protein
LDEVIRNSESRPVQHGAAKSVLHMMVSVWLAVGMFLLGAYAGMLMLGLMRMAATEHEQGVKEEETAERDRLGPVNSEEEWTAKVALSNSQARFL